MKSIVEKLKINPKSYYFKNPAIRQLDTKKLKEEYKSIISHPMDLGTSMRKINNSKYNTFQEFYDDLNLIWDNAQIYNEVGSEVYEHAEYMRNYMEKLFNDEELVDKVVHKEKVNKEENENKEKIEPNKDEKNKEENEKENKNEVVEEKDKENNNDSFDDIEKLIYDGNEQDNNNNNGNDENVLEAQKNSVDKNEENVNVNENNEIVQNSNEINHQLNLSEINNIYI